MAVPGPLPRGALVTVTWNRPGHMGAAWEGGGVVAKGPGGAWGEEVLRILTAPRAREGLRVMTLRRNKHTRDHE